MTDNSSYVDLGDCLPVDTITDLAHIVGLALSATEEGKLFGSLLVATDDGWHRYLLPHKMWNDLLKQAAYFSDMCSDPSKLAATVETLKKAHKEDQ